MSAEAEINQCPPGADITISALAQLTGKPRLRLNPANGIAEPRLLARINEAACIGCRLCIKACPVDAIIGAAKVMHTVIENECTGCKLCVPVCPTDCIELLPATPISPRQKPSRWQAFSQAQVDTARLRIENNLKRQAQREARKQLHKVATHRAQLQLEIAAVLARKRGATNHSG